MNTRKLRLDALHRVLELARQHAVESGGNNRGPLIDKIIDYAGGDRGEPYCVDTVIWGYGHAGSKVVRPGYPRAVRLMDVPGVHRTDGGKAGCIVRYVFDHTGLFIGYRRQVRGRWVLCPRKIATHIKACEGNTSPVGAERISDGANRSDGVYVKYRPLAQVRDYLYVDR